MTDLQDIEQSQSGGSAKVIYILYLASLVVGITSLIAVIMAYLNKDDGPDWLQTHYHYQIRTFWIALLYSVVAAGLCLIVIGYLLVPLVVIWLIIRCLKGLKLLQQNRGHPEPTTWLF